MDTITYSKLRTFLLFLNTVEVLGCFFFIYTGESIASCIILFLLSMNLIFSEVLSIRHQTFEDAVNCQTKSELAEMSESFDEQISALNRSNTALSNQNELLHQKLASCEARLSSFPKLYNCPLTAATPVNLGKILSMYYSDHESDFFHANIYSSIHIESCSFLSLLSKSAFTLICDNLLDNTLKYTPAYGTAVITLTCQENDILLIWKNSGNGVSAEQSKKVFDLNYRINHPGSGTGLGLAQTRMIIEDFNGSIRSSSSEGNGFAIYIRIPGIRKGDDNL